jgi:hypothetical protein
VTGGSLAAALIPIPSDPSHQAELAYDSSLNREMEVALRESIGKSGLVYTTISDPEHTASDFDRRTFRLPRSILNLVRGLGP